MTALGALTWPEVDRARSVLLVPLGSCEQHGPHLPLDTDTVVAQAVAEGVAGRADDLLVAPAVPYGSSGEHQAFAGTLSIGQDALERTVVELVRSAGGFAAVVLVNGHAGNGEPVERAVASLRREGRSVAAWWPRPEQAHADAHAGRTETSLLLAIAPQRVRLELAEPGATGALADLMPTLRDRGVAAVSSSGVLGDPTGASAAEGQVLLDGFVADCERLVRSLAPTVA